MSNHIDQLFKDSLSEHKISPSAGAWEKVQSGLSKKNKIVIVWRMAAVLVLFGAVVGWWYFLNNGERIAPAQLTETNEWDTPKIVNDQKSQEATLEKVNPAVAQTGNVVIHEKIKETHANTQQVKKPSENLTIYDNEVSKEVLDNAIVTKPIPVAQTAKHERPIVIEFTLESISKTHTTEVAKTSEEENSALKKILYAARDMKNGESDLGLLRDTKNQLFALDLKKDKTKRN